MNLTRIRKSVALVLVFTMSLSISINSFASESIAIDEEDVQVSADDVNICYKDKIEYDNLSQELAENIGENVDAKSVEKTIQAFTSDTKIDEIQEEIVEELSDAIDEKITAGKRPNIEMTADFKKEYEHTYVVDDNTSITINPLYIVVSDTQEDGDAAISDENNNMIVGFIDNLFTLKVYAASKTKTKTKTFSDSKTYYSWVGFKIFTLGLTCNFYYNGKKAWYKSGFDGWYKRATLSIWQVSNWKEKREKNGKSYNARCSGNFHYGLEVKGIGLVIQDLYVSHTATCNKNGLVSVSDIVR